MMLRIIHGKLKPGTWDSYERAYKDVLRQVYGMLLERMRNPCPPGRALLNPACRPRPRAQQPAMPVIGYLSSGSSAAFAPMA